MTWSANRRLAIVLGLCLFLPLVPIAGEFWLEKSSADWSEKEAETILSKSPWGKDQMFVIRGTKPWGRAGTDPVRGDATGRGGSEGQEGQRRQPVRLNEDLDITVIYRVVWYSSTKVQQALSRLEQLRGLPQNQEATQMLDTREHYVVGVDTSSLGSDRLLKIIEDSNLELLKSKTRLVSKRSSTKDIELKEYVSPVNRRDGMALFLFSRRMGDAPLLDLDDGDVQFVTEIGPLRIKASFKLARMVVAGKLDL